MTDVVGINPTVVSNYESGLGPTIRPIRYRYALADIRTGEIVAMLPMTSVTYSVGIYSGQDMSGTVYIPDMYLDLMVHPPGNDYVRVKHPDRGSPLGSMFEVGNRAIYVMRNDEVVWGGILWTRAYSSADSTMSLTALSWEGYIYYRALRKTVAFLTSTDKYTIWRALLGQTLAQSTTAGGVIFASDFNWKGEDGKGKNAGAVTAEGGNTVPWTGITRDNKSNQTPTAYVEHWPYNAPNIELPPAGLTSGLMGKVDQDWRGYDMNMVGDALQQWADIITLTQGEGFEYRVLCWWDQAQQRFRQRYTFGEMIYPGDDYTKTPTGILRNLIGKNTEGKAHSMNNELIFDFPGQISEWSLAESMEDSATRVIVKGSLGDGANAIAAYKSQINLLGGATLAPDYGKKGWLLYDKVFSYDMTGVTDSVTKLKNRADKLATWHHPPTATTLDDVEGSNDGKQHSSSVSTQLGITLYVDPTTTVPEWGIGDWAAFAIQDPFYGGKIYLVRRIISYSVTVVPDHESDYSHEQITLELTDVTRTAEGT